ncbi:MAG: flagellar assembly protein FliW [Oscillospiraceae bacterium]
MEIKTRDFGTVEAQESDLLTFKAPIYGFEDYSRFLMLFDDEIGDGYCWLQSAEDAQVCFILANVSAAADFAPEGYRPVFPPECEKLLGAGEKETWLVMVAAENFEDSTVNLKSPIAVNSAAMTAGQFILEESYPIRYPLFLKKECAGC